MKYQIMIHMKDNEYESSGRGYEHKYDGYIISFKGVFDTIKEGIKHIFTKYEDLLKAKKILPEKVSEHMTITRIDPIKCEKWDKLYLNMKVE